MKTPVQKDPQTSAPRMSGTNRGSVAIPSYGPGTMGEYGKGKGKARIAEAFPADTNWEPRNEGKGYRP